MGRNIEWPWGRQVGSVKLGETRRGGYNERYRLGGRGQSPPNSRQG